MRMSEEAVDVWLMPFKSQEFVRGPELTQHVGDATLRLDCEAESGRYEWKVVYFTGDPSDPIYGMALLQSGSDPRLRSVAGSKRQ